MDNSAIQTLEAAAQVLLAPPNLVNSEQRHQAESVFMEFRSTKNPYQLCREILEKSSSGYVLFEATGLIKSALVREWNLLSDSDLCSLREYLLSYLLRSDTPPFIREKLLQTIAVMIKRGSINDSGRERKALLDELEKIILGSSIGQQKLACALIQAIMQEYAITVKSADVGLTWEVHFWLKKSFEATDLKRIFRFTVGVLEQIVRSGVCPEGDQAILTKQLLTIVESVLCWSHVSPFLSKRLTGAFEAIYESDSTPLLRLSLNWKDTIMKPELIALFFEIYMYVRLIPELANPSLTCLVQLASLTGVVVSESNLKQQYLENYVNSFMRMLSMIQPIDREMLGISDIYRRLVQFFTPPLIAASPPAFLQNLTTYTCYCIRGSVVEEGINEDTVWREALNKFLHTWSSLVCDVDGFTNDTLRTPCIEIFNTYLQCRLAPPDGTRGTESNDGCADDINEDIQEDERTLHCNVLLTIGLEAQLQLMHAGKIPIGSSDQLVSLFEDLHWINANVEASLRYLIGESTNSENVDPIIMISSYECAALDAGLGSVFSPELSASVSWLLKIWSNSYLAPQTQIAEVILPTINLERPLPNCKEFLDLVAWEAAGNNLPGDLRKELHRAFAIAVKLQNILNIESDTEPVRNMLADTLDCFTGISEGISQTRAVDEQFTMLVAALERIPNIVYKYHNYPGVVLPAINLLSKSARRVLHSGPQDNYNKFLEVCNATFDVYNLWNSDKISSIPQDAEEEAYELTILPIEDFNMVVTALRVGLTAVSCDVSTLCCDTIVGVANKVRTMPADNPYANSILSLAELLLMLIIKMEIPPDSIPAAGGAIYALTCVKPALLEGLARQLIDSFAMNDPANVPKLEEAFRVLTNRVLFDGHRTHKVRFQDNFDKFLASVHGFLIIK
ncbi:unnamed protein product [Leptidea sinapis]|uniref:Exportin-4 n=1 Tax=Leptidea sinapis TaxID=189913 RepID=A0A5E4PS73_9NEOP|nr:unnamed protein product [Leptidea sinapis]